MAKPLAPRWSKKIISAAILAAAMSMAQGLPAQTGGGFFGCFDNGGTPFMATPSDGGGLSVKKFAIPMDLRAEQDPPPSSPLVVVSRTRFATSMLEGDTGPQEGPFFDDFTVTNAVTVQGDVINLQIDTTPEHYPRQATDPIPSFLLFRNSNNVPLTPIGDRFNGGAIADGEGATINIELNPAVVATLAPGHYRETITLYNGASENSIDTIYFYLVVYKAFHMYNLSFIAPTNADGAKVVLRAKTPDNTNFNAALCFRAPNDVAEKVIPLYSGNSGATSGYSVPSGSNVDVDVYLDDAASDIVDKAFDRSIPAVSGRWAPSASYIKPLEFINAEPSRGLTNFSSATAGGTFTFYFFDNEGTANPGFQLVEFCLLAGEEKEGDLNPRGNPLGGSGVRGLLNITDQIYSAFHLVDFDFVDTRLKAPVVYDDAKAILPVSLDGHPAIAIPNNTDVVKFSPKIDGTYKGNVSGTLTLFIDAVTNNPDPACGQIDFTATFTPNTGAPVASSFSQSTNAPVSIDSVVPGLTIDFDNPCIDSELLVFLPGATYTAVIEELPSHVPDSLARGLDPSGISPTENFRDSLKNSEGTELSRLDVSPTSSGGDGLVTISDFVQIGRYIAGAGFDPAVPEKGPIGTADRMVRFGSLKSSLTPSGVPELGDRNSRVTIARGQTVRVPVVMRAKGIEQKVSLGIKFDPNLLEFVSAQKPERVPTAAGVLPDITFQVDNSAQGQGQVGFEVGLNPGVTFPIYAPTADLSYLTNPAAPIAAPFTTGRGVNFDVIVGYVTFKAKEGSGTVNTEIEFIQGGPLGPRASTVRTEGDTIVPATFVSCGLTILDASGDQPTVRIPTTVINQGGDGTIDIILGSVGIENATGFALKFNPADLDIIGIEPGRSLPIDAFFLSNPDYFNPTGSTTPGHVLDAKELELVAKTDEAGKLNLLVALQPGETFPGGNNIIATLRVRAKTLLDNNSVRSAITFEPLGDSLDVVDVNGIPIASRFVNANPPITAEQVIITPGNCIYTLAVDPPSEGTVSTVEIGVPPVSVTQVAVPLEGATGVVHVNVSDPSCVWVPQVDQAWVQLSSTAQQTNSGQFSYTVAPLAGASTRTARVTVVDKQFIIVQSGCTIDSITPTFESFTGLGGSGSFTIDVANDICEYTAVSASSFVTITSGANGTGDGTVQFTVAPGDGTPRVGAIRITQPGSNLIYTFNVYQDFEEFVVGGNEGWQFGNAAPFLSSPTPNPDVPAGTVVSAGRLDLTTTNNVNNFGYWRSPVFTLSTPSTVGSLYRATMRVTTDASAVEVPAIRLRASAADFAQTAELTISSSGPAPTFVPGADPARVYQHFFNLPENETRFQLFFDVINATPDDAAVARVSLESIALTRIDTLNGAISNPVIVPKNNPSEWVPVSVEPYFTAPVFSTDARGIGLRHPQTDPNVAGRAFGFYDYLSSISISKTRLYRFDFTVSARDERTTNIRKSQVPAFRLRLNDTSVQSSSLLQVESISDSSRIPTFTQNQTYTVWYLGDDALDGDALSSTPAEKIRAAFDYLYVPESQNDPGIALVLESLNITSYNAP